MKGGRIPEIKSLPTARDMAAQMVQEGGGKLYSIGSEVQVANRTLIAHDAHRLREELKRGAMSVDLQDVSSVKSRTLEYLTGCEMSARVPLWGGLCARALNLSRQYVARWMATHAGHETTAFLIVAREAFADSLASAALNGSVSPIPAIFSLKSQCGWRDGGADDGNVIGTEDDEASFDLRQILARYEGQDAAEGTSETVDDYNVE